ncbi:unnamed protein product, partial [Ectocarpus sp. 13 AM-2016]
SAQHRARHWRRHQPGGLPLRGGRHLPHGLDAQGPGPADRPAGGGHLPPGRGGLAGVHDSKQAVGCARPPGDAAVQQRPVHRGRLVVRRGCRILGTVRREVPGRNGCRLWFRRGARPPLRGLLPEEPRGRGLDPPAHDQPRHPVLRTPGIRARRGRAAWLEIRARVHRRPRRSTARARGTRAGVGAVAGEAGQNCRGEGC